MAPSVLYGKCIACGKNRNKYPAMKLHYLPRDTRKRMKWLQILNLAYHKGHQAICRDHFDPIYYASQSRLLPHAVPRPPLPHAVPRSPVQDVNEEEQSTDPRVTDDNINAAPMSDAQTLHYEAVPPIGFGNPAWEDHQTATCLRAIKNVPVPQHDQQQKRMQWLKNLNIAYERESQSICEDHFDHIYYSKEGRLLKHAVPRPSDDSQEHQSQLPRVVSAISCQSAGPSSTIDVEEPTQPSDTIVQPLASHLDMEDQSHASHPAVRSSLLSLEMEENNFDMEDNTPMPHPPVLPSLPESCEEATDINTSKMNTDLTAGLPLIDNKIDFGTASSSTLPQQQERMGSSFFKKARLQESHVALDAGKKTCNEDCKCKKCFTKQLATQKTATTTVQKDKNTGASVSETVKTTGVTKQQADNIAASVKVEAVKMSGGTTSITQSFPGSIRQQIVRTKSGETRTIMIVNKASLKNLQEKGLIQPLSKYMAKHPSTQQPVKESQSSSVSGERSISCQTPGSFSLKKTDLSEKSTSIVTAAQPTTGKHGVVKSSTQPTKEPSASSHASSQTTKPQTTTNQASKTPLLEPDVLSDILNKSGIATTFPNRTESASEVPRDAKLPSQKETDTDNDSCSSMTGTDSATKSSSSVTPKDKQLKPKSMYVIIPNSEKLKLCSNKSADDKSGDNNNQSADNSKKENQPVKKHLESRDSLKWNAVPSSFLMPSSPGIFDQDEPDNFTINCRVPNRAHSLLSPRMSDEVSINESDEDELQMKVPMKAIPAPIYKSANKELKKRYRRLLYKYRRKYFVLMKKFVRVQRRLNIKGETGSPQQIIRDARKHLSEEHCLFLESQMFLKNRAGSGNRFSRKFMHLMIEYYKRSAAGYRYLRTIFTIPTVGTIRKWLEKQVEIQGSSEDVVGVDS